MGIDRIVQNPEVMIGQASIAGTRLTVSRVLGALAAYPDRKELLENYPGLDEDAIQQVLAYAAAAVDDRVFELADSK